MGSKYHWTLTAADRRMLRAIELDPAYRPTTTNTTTRLAKLMKLGYVVRVKNKLKVKL